MIMAALTAEILPRFGAIGNAAGATVASHASSLRAAADALRFNTGSRQLELNRKLDYANESHWFDGQFADIEPNRKHLNQLNGPETLVLVLKQNDDRQSALKEQQHSVALLKAVAEAIWKLCYSPEACERFRQLGVVRLFVRHLNQHTEDVKQRCHSVTNWLIPRKLCAGAATYRQRAVHLGDGCGELERSGRPGGSHTVGLVPIRQPSRSPVGCFGDHGQSDLRSGDAGTTGGAGCGAAVLVASETPVAAGAGRCCHRHRRLLPTFQSIPTQSESIFWIFDLSYFTYIYIHHILYIYLWYFICIFIIFDYILIFV